VRGKLAIGAAALAAALSLATLATGAVIQQANLRITVLSQILPYKLPRAEVAPIAVFISGHVGAVDGTVPPQLQRMDVKVNRHGLLQSQGLAKCAPREIEAVSSDQALANCGAALIGSGRFWATIVLPDQRPYPTRGRLLVFNGKSKGRAALFAHIYTTNPFATSFVIAFAIKKIDKGPYGTELSASLPQALGSWGFVDRIKLTLRRKYQYKGTQRSYFNAACPAPRGTSRASFSLALASFYFKGQKPIELGVQKSCGVSG
jgi:hypothetical protein